LYAMSFPMFWCSRLYAMSFPQYISWVSIGVEWVSEKCENQMGFQVAFKFETLGVSHREMPFIKHGCKVLGF
jgi:hypothetical protein